MRIRRIAAFTTAAIPLSCSPVAMSALKVQGLSAADSARMAAVADDGYVFGRVRQLGVSYPGWLTVMSMLDPHPALKAVSPQASPASMFLGDGFHHNGAVRVAYGFEYVADERMAHARDMASEAECHLESAVLPDSATAT